jgi:hypothetical protein
MTELTIKRQNAFTGDTYKCSITFNQNLTKETIDQIHWLMSSNHPDDYVNITDNRGGFICGQPENMKLDDTKIAKGEMTLEEYVKKWYSPKK